MPADGEVVQFSSALNQWVSAAISTGAPTDATYLTQTTNASLSAEVVIGNIKGQIITADGTNITLLTVGTDTFVLVADSAQANGIKWAAIVNANVSATAAIAYSKLNLATSIVNADISATAEIAVSKLANGTAFQRIRTDSAGTGVEYFTEVSTLTFIIDGGGSAITTGQKGHLEIPFACTITGWTLVADQSGSIVIDVWKDTYANFPPTVADTIAGSEKPTLSTAQKNQDLTLTTWTTAVTAGDILAFNVDSITTVTRVTLSIRVNKSD